MADEERPRRKVKPDPRPDLPGFETSDRIPPNRKAWTRPVNLQKQDRRRKRTEEKLKVEKAQDEFDLVTTVKMLKRVMEARALQMNGAVPISWWKRVVAGETPSVVEARRVTQKLLKENGWYIDSLGMGIVVDRQKWGDFTQEDTKTKLEQLARAVPITRDEQVGTFGSTKTDEATDDQVADSVRRSPGRGKDRVDDSPRVEGRERQARRARHPHQARDHRSPPEES